MESLKRLSLRTLPRSILGQCHLLISLQTTHILPDTDCYQANFMFSFSPKNLISSGHEQKAQMKLEHNQKMQEMYEQILTDGTMTAS